MIVAEHLYGIVKSNDTRMKPWDASYVIAPVTEIRSLGERWIYSRGALKPFDDW